MVIAGEGDRRDRGRCNQKQPAEDAPAPTRIAGSASPGASCRYDVGRTIRVAHYRSVADAGVAEGLDAQPKRSWACFTQRDTPTGDFI
jgi:hypothetical protein